MSFEFHPEVRGILYVLQCCDQICRFRGMKYSQVEEILKPGEEENNYRKIYIS